MEPITETLAGEDVTPENDDNRCESIVLVLGRLLVSADVTLRSGLPSDKYDETEAALRLLPIRLGGVVAVDVTGTAASSRSHSAVKCFVKLSSEIEHDVTNFSNRGIFDGSVFGMVSFLLTAAD